MRVLFAALILLACGTAQADSSTQSFFNQLSKIAQPEMNVAESLKAMASFYGSMDPEFQIVAQAALTCSKAAGALTYSAFEVEVFRMPAREELRNAIDGIVIHNPDLRKFPKQLAEEYISNRVAVLRQFFERRLNKSFADASVIECFLKNTTFEPN